MSEFGDNIQSERRANNARRSSRFSLSEDRCSRASPKQTRPKNQNPRNGLLSCHGPVDRGFGAVCFGVSPLAAVFGSSPGARLPRESISLYAKEQDACVFGYFLT